MKPYTLLTGKTGQVGLRAPAPAPAIDTRRRSRLKRTGSREIEQIRFLMGDLSPQWGVAFSLNVSSPSILAEKSMGSSSAQFITQRIMSPMALRSFDT